MTFIKDAKPFVIVWIAILAICIAIITLVGMTLGVDFTGGTLLERGIAGQRTAADVHDALNAIPDIDFSGASIQVLDSGERDNETIVVVRTAELSNEQRVQVDASLTEAFGTIVDRRTEVVGPVVGKELVRQAIMALLLSGAAVLIYLSFRFEWRFGVAALLAVTFDVLFILTVLALMGTEINTPFVAAVLTVVGYSLNNTIVIFDRVRENLSFRRKESTVELLNRSIHQSLTRAINTSVSTLLVLLALLFLGGSTLRDFTLTLTLGVIVGTVSSLYFAPAIWLALQKDARKQRPAAADSRA